MKDVALLLNEMMTAQAIQNYAVFGAIAQMRYTEAVSTFDADILVALPDADRLDALSPIYRFCKARGFCPVGEAIQVGKWPVQFIPVFDEVSREALEKAETTDYDGVPLRVVSAAFLALMALKTGRSKDFVRILALFEAKATSRTVLEPMARQYGLLKEWNTFMSRFLNE